MVLSLKQVVALLETIAPLGFAEPWDNVGLLVEAPRLAASDTEPRVGCVLLTIDLTEDVLSEALERQAELIVAYHPPIFEPLKRLSAVKPLERLIIRTISEGVSIYSPHTALDAAPLGVNDWLAAGLGPAEVQALCVSERVEDGAQFKLVVFVPSEHADELRRALSEQAGAGVIGQYSNCSFNIEGTGTFFGRETATPRVGEALRLERVGEIRMEMVCSKDSLRKAARIIARLHPYEEPAWDVYPLAPKLNPAIGMGRYVKLIEPTSLESLTQRVKDHLGLRGLRIAIAERHRNGMPIREVAVCAGSGGSLFRDVHGIDLFVTGEMSHHAILAKLAHGSSVIVCDHTHTERGYLPSLRDRLKELSQDLIQVFVSQRDHDPLTLI